MSRVWALVQNSGFNTMALPSPKQNGDQNTHQDSSGCLAGETLPLSMQAQWRILSPEDWLVSADADMQSCLGGSYSLQSSKAEATQQVDQ
jgi:hypothetical protein